MKKELDDLLCQRYPLIFSQRHLSIKESTMGWGFSCHDGWFDLIDTLCERLQYWTDNNKAPQVVADQVKEKFGELRFYCSNCNDVQGGMIFMAEAMSACICEQCGKPGKAVVRGFYHMTRCAEHTPEDAIPLEDFLRRKQAFEDARAVKRGEKS